MHPANLLALLTTISAIGGSICWSSFQRVQLRQSLAAAGSGDGSADSPLPEISVGTIAEGPTGTLQKQVQTLEEQNQLLTKENKDLRERLARELEAKIPPPKPEDLAKRLTDLRKLNFVTPPSYKAIPMNELQTKIMQDTAQRLTDAACAARSKAFVAMGFVLDAFDYREAMQNLMGNQFNTFYDAATNEAFYQDDADLRRMDGRDVMIAAAHRALVSQTFTASQPLPLETDQDDAALALRCLALGENAFYRVRWALQDDLVNLTDKDPPLQPAQSHTPLFFTEQYKFTVDAGKLFVEDILERGTHSALTNAYSRPPTSSAEVLHPELYFASPPFKPTEITFPTLTANGVEPYFNNVAGEFQMDMMFRYHMSPDLSARITEGWAGDRYVVYAGDAQHGDHVLWKTAWRTPEDGVEFFDGIRRILMQRHVIPHQPEYNQPRSFIMTDPHRAIRVRISEDKMTVSVVNATSATMADALDSLTGVK